MRRTCDSSRCLRVFQCSQRPLLGTSESLEQCLAAQGRRSAQDIPTATYSQQLAHEMVSFTKDLLLTWMNALELACDYVQLRQSLRRLCQLAYICSRSASLRPRSDVSAPSDFSSSIRRIPCCRLACRRPRAWQPGCSGAVGVMVALEELKRAFRDRAAGRAGATIRVPFEPKAVAFQTIRLTDWRCAAAHRVVHSRRPARAPPGACREHRRHNRSRCPMPGSHRERCLSQPSLEYCQRRRLWSRLRQVSV